MATKSEKERLAIVEVEVKNVKSTVQEIKGDVKTILKKFDHLDERYPTRREVSVFKWVVGTAILIIGVVAAFK